jgi:phenylalanyl-tRNA synthetase alpha chain
MQAKLEALQEKALAKLAALHTAEQVKDWLITYTGRNSQLTETLRSIKELKESQRAEIGQLANQIRTHLEEKGEAVLQKLKQAELDATLKEEFMDVSVPGTPPTTAGGLHPHTIETEKIIRIFREMGFGVWEPYMIDTDYNTFTALNIPAGHPARDMWDTIRLDEERVLITHTSSMQNRILSSGEMPIRAIVPGKTFRNEATDARHEHSFFQLEGVYVDRGIKLSDLIGTLKAFLSFYFERDIQLKIQPTFFPFVEPGLELMMNCPVCNGAKPKDCAGCGGGGWMEVIPCGPIHPAVLREANLDPEVYSGFAWGVGLDRLIMIKNQINDVRNFHTGRIDFVQQFN